MTGYRFPRYVSLACPCAKCVGPKLRWGMAGAKRMTFYTVQFAAAVEIWFNLRSKASSAQNNSATSVQETKLER